MHDTFYVEGGMVLRTHTSPVQVRYMETHAPPIKIIAPGRVYRVDSDATHSPMFHQVEGLWIDENVTLRRFEGRVHRVPAPLLRARRSARCGSARRSSRSPSPRRRSTWASATAGSRSPERGQVHPNVLRAVGIDPERYQGFAFGMGPDRLAMLRYGVNDLRLFYRERSALPAAVRLT